MGRGCYAAAHACSFAHRPVEVLEQRVGTMADTILDTAATTGNLTVNGTTLGTIDATPMTGSFDTTLDHDWYAITLTAGHTYTFSGLGLVSLNDVAIDLSDANRNILNSQGVVDSGIGGQALFTYSTAVTGTFYLAIGAGGSNPASLTGSYQINVTDNGADTALDTPATTASLTMNGFTTGKIDGIPANGSFDSSFDHDWLAVTLTAGHTYSFQAVSTGGNLNDLAVDLQDANRNIVNHQGVVDGGTNGLPSFSYTAPTTGTFYFAISAGGSNPASLTGSYQISAFDGGLQPPDTVLDTPATTASLTMNGTVTGTIDALPESGSFNTSVDHDWFAVNLTAGHTYTFSAFGTGLNDVAIDLSDANRNVLNSQGLVDGGANGTAIFNYTATASGTYYLAIGAGGTNAADATFSYQVSVTDRGIDTVLDTPATTASLTMNGTVTGTIDVAPGIGSFNTSVDHDWFAVTLTAGERYTFSTLTTGVNLTDVAISLMNANRTVVDSNGVVDSGPGGFATITYTAPVSGTYYLAIGAGGQNAANATGGYQITTTDNGPNHLVINLVADQSVIQQFGPNYQSSAFWMGVESAASYFESNFFDPITININVGWGEIAGQPVPSNSARSLRQQTAFSFNQIESALKGDATSASDATADAHLPTTDPGTGGADFTIANAEAKALGLLNGNSSAVDGSIGFATDWNPTNANFVGAVENEMSEIMGRASGINAENGVFTGAYSVLDLFRYFAGPPVTPEPSSATGPGGQGSTYFSIDGGVTALKTFSSTAGQDPGGDWAAVGDNDAFDAIINNGPATVTATDQIEMDVLGYDTQARPIPVTIGGIDYRVPVPVGGTTVSPTSYISPASIAAAGYQFAIEYIGTASNTGYLRASDARALAQQNLPIVSVFAKSGMSDTDAVGNYTNAWVGYFNNNGLLGQGTADAIDAINAAQAAGQTSGAIYFAVNLDPANTKSGITESAALSEIDEYFREINTYFTQVGAPYSIGVYGAGDTLSFLQADPSAGVKFTWLADTWLGEVHSVASKNLEQTDATGSATVGGQSVNLDTAYTSDFGQWVPTTVIESFGTTSLVQVGGNYFLRANGTTTGPELKEGGAPVVAGQFGAGLNPIGVEKTASGYELAWKATGADQFWVWNLDNNGNDIGHVFNGVPGNTPGLEALEPSFQQDLNGDGVIGPPPTTTVSESFGATSLVQVGSNYFLRANGTTTGPELKYAGAPVVAGQFGAGLNPIGAEQTASGYELAWKATGADQFWVWNLDSNGNDIEHVFNGVPGSTPGLEALEPSFQQDLNGDGTIGPPTGAINGASAQSATQSAGLTVADGGSLEVSGASADSISFAGSSGALVFDQASEITGQISGFTGQDRIDLPDIDFGPHTSLVFTDNGSSAGGVLAAMDVLHAASLSLLGHDLTENLTTSSDNAGRTLIVDPPVAGSGPQSPSSPTAAGPTGGAASLLLFSDA